MTHYLACDLGAESGRLMTVALQNGHWTIEELHRFSNGGVMRDGHLVWDIQRLFAELVRGLRMAASRSNGTGYASVSTDAWGLDYVLLDADGGVIEPCFHYRDPRTARGVEAVMSKTTWEAIFESTGVQFMPMNTLYQLASESSERWPRAHRILSVADAFNFFLSGTARIEESMASTFQLYRPRQRAWDDDLLRWAGVPKRLFPEVVPSGTRLGPLRTALSVETGLSGLEVIASCSHDTGAAVAAIPAKERSHWAFLSSGTWSLLGVERTAPILTELARTLNFTNEIGVGRSIRFLKNIIGLWLVQECRRVWAAEGRSWDYGVLTAMAAEAPPFAALIDPTQPRFLAPKDMVAELGAYCRETGQRLPADPGGIIRCILESLALLYRQTLRQLEIVSGDRIEVLHIVGGGSRNELLNQWTADAIGRPVVAGPVEATALGNALVQAIALQHVPSLAAGRAQIRTSFPLRTYVPRNPAAWNKAWIRFERLTSPREPR